jgi:hypothetical protein
MQQLQIANPLDIKDWDARILAFPEATVFHSSFWARVLIESYGFKPRYIVKFDGDRFVAVLPLMEVRDLFAGRKAVCLPFSDFCSPLYRDSTVFHEVFEYAKQAARAKQWRFLTISGNAPFPENTPASPRYFRHVLRLNTDENLILKNFRNTTRRNIMKATTGKVIVAFDKSPDAVREFCRLNCLTRKRHGLPPQPMRFFEKMHQIIMAQSHGMIALGRIGKRVVSASVFFEFGKTAFYKYGASDDRYSDTCANYAIMWEAIRSYGSLGYETFCFGKTEPQHEGLLQFKNGWGAEQQTINNYAYNVKNDAFVRSPQKTSGIHNTVFRLMPVPVLKILSFFIYKYMG